MVLARRFKLLRFWYNQHFLRVPCLSVPSREHIILWSYVKTRFIILKGVAVRAFIMAVRAGFEPTTRQSKCLVLPLHQRTIKRDAFKLPFLWFVSRENLFPLIGSSVFIWRCLEARLPSPSAFLCANLFSQVSFPLNEIDYTLGYEESKMFYLGI